MYIHLKTQHTCSARKYQNSHFTHNTLVQQGKIKFTFYILIHIIGFFSNHGIIKIIFVHYMYMYYWLEVKIKMLKVFAFNVPFAVLCVLTGHFFFFQSCYERSHNVETNVWQTCILYAIFFFRMVRASHAYVIEQPFFSKTFYIRK